MSDALDLARRTLEGHKGHAQNKDGWDFNECCTLAGEVVAQAARIAELEADVEEQRGNAYGFWEDLEKARARIAELEGRIAELEAKIDRAEWDEEIARAAQDKGAD